MATIGMREMLEAGAHFGHQTRRWNPKMKRFIFGERNGIYIIDLQKTLVESEKSFDFLKDLAARGSTILFVGTKKQAQEILAAEAKRCGMPFVNERWLGGLSSSNAQGEYYLTDVIAMAVAEGFEIQVSQPDSAIEAEGVNNRVQLAALERAHQSRVARQLMLAGVTVRDPARIDVRGELRHGVDVEIDFNALFEGRVILGDRVRIGANCVLRDVEIGDDVEIGASSTIDRGAIGDTVIDGGSDAGTLRVPHSRLHERRFVLVPVCDIAPD